MKDRYNSRTVQWGHWAITFMNPQPDRSKNFGDIVGHVSFPVANGCGPQDAGAMRETYRAMCSRWIDDGILPEGLVPYSPR
jgi:hypothetical protein